MRTILAICGLCIAINGSTLAQKSDRDRDGMKGPVKTVTVRQGLTVIENGKRHESPLVLTHVISYDQLGKRTEVRLYDEKTGALSRRIVYEYDSATKRRSALIAYNSNDVMVRKVIDRFGDNGVKVGSIIQTFNDDGTLFRRTEITFNAFGEVTEVSQYKSDGSPVKDNDASNQSESETVTSTGRLPIEQGDYVVSYGQSGGEYFDPDVYGNWTRGSIASTFRTYSSGQKSKQTTWAYREFTYY